MGGPRPLTVTDSTLSGNAASGGTGGTGGVGGGEGSGGGIYSIAVGPLTVTASTLSGNTARGSNIGGGLGASGANGWGGGIYRGAVVGPLAVTTSTLSDNSATGGNGGNLGTGEGSGGGIYSIAVGPLTVTASTLSGNSAVGGNGSFSFGRGGGIYSAGAGPLAVTGSTLTGNTAVGGNGGAGSGGGISGTVTALWNTIIAGNTASSATPDVSGSLGSQGHNLIGIGDGGSGYHPTDLVGTSQNPIDPWLGPLQDNGGPTFTHALLPGSPTIDAGDNTDAPEFDQRGPGFPRIVNGTIDIGAFEVQAAAPTVTCSVGRSLLWPPNHRLVNVGLGVVVEPPGATLHVAVYGNDGADSSDAASIAPDTLRLRAERRGGGQGRVYLVVATASNPSGSSFDVCWVAVPHSQSAAAIARVRAEAAAAAAYYRDTGMAPKRYELLGEGPGRAVPGGGAGGQSRDDSIADAAAALQAAAVRRCEAPAWPLVSVRVAAGPLPADHPTLLLPAGGAEQAVTGLLEPEPAGDGAGGDDWLDSFVRVSAQEAWAVRLPG